MKTKLTMTAIVTLMSSTAAFAGEASTSATATNGYGHPGHAGATANYDGDGGQGFARTRTDTGNINRASGLAVGYDRDGVDLSFSHAIAPKFGPAFASTMNLSFGREGVTGSYGNSVANGGLARTVEAAGSTSSDRRSSGATAITRGDTVGGGSVVANSTSFDNRNRSVGRVGTHGDGARYTIARSSRPVAYRR
jgi:hypothetical protein